MSRRRNRRTGTPQITKAATVRGATTFTPDQVIGLMRQALTASASQTTGALAPLARVEPQVAFGPGLPVIPGAIDPLRLDTRRPEPRINEYPVSSNLPGSSDRLVPWSVLRAAARQIPLFRRCIEIRKAQVSTLEWGITISKTAVETAQQADPGASRADIENGLRDRLSPEIARCTGFWEEPYRDMDYTFPEWISAVFEDHLVLDAVAIYPRFTRGGHLYALEPIDGSTIKLLRDHRGARPLPPNPAYQQVLHGFPRGEFVADIDPDGRVVNGMTADQLIYRRRNTSNHDIYGYSPVEQALVDGDLYLRRHQWMRAEYTEGTMPTGWLRLVGAELTWTPQQIREYERDVNDTYSGNTEVRHRLRILPPGLEPDSHPDVAERYRPEYDLYLIELVASHFDVTIAELGYTKPGGLGSTGWHEGQEDVQNRKATQPDLRWWQSFLTAVSRRHLQMPAELEFRFLGLESEDEAAADQVALQRVQTARMTLNEDRDRLGLPRYDFDEADKPLLMTQRGVVFLEGAAATAAAGVLVGPPDAPAASAPGGGPAVTDTDTGDGTDDGGDAEPKPKVEPDAVKAEVAAYRRWAAKRGNRPGRPFRFTHLTKTDATAAGVDLALVEFATVGKGGDGGRPKVVWPGWAKDRQVAARWAPRLSRASTGAVDAQDLAGDWLTVRKADTAAQADARQWLHDHRDTLAAAIAAILAGLWVDGYLVGALSARALLAAEAAAGAAVGVDWLGWEPGDTDRAEEILTAIGLAEALQGLLARARAVAGGIADTRLVAVARILADSSGMGAAELAAAIADALGTDMWAELVAITETTRASTAAALAVYLAGGVEATEWETEHDQRVCGTCRENEEAGPVPIGQLFPDGSDAPPAHPGCRCAPAPVRIPFDEAALFDATFA